MKETIVTQRATIRMTSILDSKYEKGDLKAVIDGAHRLNEKGKRDLYWLLLNYGDIFYGTLGEWKSDLVNWSGW